MKILARLLAAASGCLALASAAPSFAQSIDYGSLEQLFNEPVTTSATGSPQRAASAPVPMDIITAADIKRSGAVDIPTILGRLAGINVMTWGAGSADVGVRGYDQAKSPRLLVLINGRQVYTDSYGYTDWSALPVRLEEIRQIEVVKGPNSALFGFNAVSGVINIVTFNPKYDNVNAVDVTTGTQAYAGIDLVKTFKLGDILSSRVSLGASRSNEFKNTDDAQILPSSVESPKTLSASLDSIAQLTPQLQARLEVSWSNDNNSTALPNNIYTALGNYTGSQRLSLLDESPIGLLEGSVYQNESYTKFVDFGNIDWKNKVLVAKVQDLLKVDPRDTIRIAMEYRHNEMNSDPIDTGSVFYDVYSPSVMITSTITSKLSATVAARYDQLKLGFDGSFPSYVQLTTSEYNRTIGAFSANAGVVYAATDDDTFRLSYARGVQSPTLAELGGFHAAIQEPYFAIDITGNPSIEPSIVTNYEADWDRAFPAVAAKAYLRLYYQTTTAVKGIPSELGLNLYPTATQEPLIWFQNVGNSDMTGLEASASGTLSKGWRWNANYTYTNVQNQPQAGVSLLGHFADYADTTPKNMANLGLGWTGAKWTVDGWLHYTSAYQDYPISYALPSLAKVGDCANLDGRVAYALTQRLTFAVSGQQLNSARIVETVGLPVERRIFASLSANW
jgi:iron complex outermembrane receptor protein